MVASSNDQDGPGFCSRRDLQYMKPTARHTLSEFGLHRDAALVDFAVSEPFQLISPTGVERLVAELQSQEVQAVCRFSTSRAPCCLRGVAAHSEFIKQLWSSAEVTSAVSQAAGIRLVPIMDYELGCANVQVEDDRGAQANVDDWHTDSYPFVCIVMLSDPSDMLGGETVCQKAGDELFPIRFPTSGSAIVMQGMEVRHCARRATSRHQRVTMVTSYVPADKSLPDRSILRGVVPMSDTEELFSQWSIYRLQSLAAKASMLAQELGERKRATGKVADLQQVKQQCTDMITFLRATVDEMSLPSP